MDYKLRGTLRLIPFSVYVDKGSMVKIFFSLKCIASMAGWGGAMPQLFYCIVKVVHIGMKATEQLNN